LRRKPFEAASFVGWARRSALRVAIPLGSSVFGSLFFLAREPGRFSEDDVDFARRVADHLALALSHQHLAEAERRDAAARETAARLEAQWRR
jgi:GAF domain-containing protein